MRQIGESDAESRREEHDYGEMRTVIEKRQHLTHHDRKLSQMRQTNETDKCDRQVRQTNVTDK